MKYIYKIYLVVLIIMAFFCLSKAQNNAISDTVKVDVKVKNYFNFIDKLVAKWNDSLDYEINEYTLVHNNAWIIDTIASLDYYLKKKQGIEIKNQRERVVIKSGTILKVPDKEKHDIIMENLLANKAIINIPEYKVRIFNRGLLIYDALARVGRNESRYLASIERYTDLRTQTGKGIIFSTEKNPTWINPVDGHVYNETTRDDKNRTKMPITPSISLKVNNVVSGQLIHATTNPITLGKAYSNGCIGVNEFDIWYLYYFLPPGSGVEIQYNLNPLNTPETDDDLTDIYKENEHVLRKE